MEILIDSKEPPQIVNQIKRHPLLSDPIVEHLSAGDIWIDDIIIERKDLASGDFFESIKDGRLFNQCAEMRELSEWCYVLIMGQLIWGADGKIIGTGWNFRSIQGVLADVQELGVSVVYAKDSNDLGRALYWLATRDRSNEKRLTARKTTIKQSVAERILDALPEITPETAAELIKKYKTPLVALDSILCGKELKTYQQSRIGAALGLENGQMIGVIDNEQTKKMAR